MIQEVHVLYLGSKGGGKEFTKDLTALLSKKKTKVHLLISSRAKDEWTYDKNISTLTVVNFSNLTIKYWFEILTIKFSNRKNQIENFVKSANTIVLPMVHPIDYALRKKFRDKSIIRIVHDARRHPGDFWPLNFMINKSLENCTKVMFLSMNVAKEFLPKLNKKYCIANHPVFGIVDLVETRKKTNYYVVVGRVRAYKGINEFIDELSTLNETCNSTHVKILGAGNLKLPKKPNITHENRWITNKEFVQEICDSMGVIFPNTEISQSGVLPIAIHFNKKILARDIPGTRDQLSKYANVVFYKEGDFAEKSNEYFALTDKTVIPKKGEWEKSWRKIIECVLQ